MKRIYKYPIRIQDEQIVHLPTGAEILCVQIQNGAPFLWALIEPQTGEEARRIVIAGTGHEMEDCERKYIGTVQMRDGTLVWHVFEKL